MIEVSINGLAADLAADTSIRLVFSNPVFDKDAISRQFTLPFSLPNSPRNRHIRKSGQRLDAAKPPQQPAQVRIDGHLILDGLMSQVRVSPDQEEVSVGKDALKLWERLGKIKINEILETVDLINPGGTEPNWEFELNTGSFPISYGIVISDGSALGTANNSGEVDTAGEDLADALNALVPDIAEYLPGPQSIRLDGWLVKDHPIVSFSGLTLNFHMNPAKYHYQNVTTHVEDVHNTPVDSHCFPCIRWHNFYGTTNNRLFTDEGLAIANACKDGEFFPNLKYTGDHRWHNTVIPAVRIPYILEKIAETLGDYLWAGDVFESAGIQKLIIMSNLSLDEVAEDQFEDLATYKLNKFNPSLNLNWHVPSMSAADLIELLCATFSLHLASDDGVLRFEKNKRVMSKRPHDLDGKAGAEYSLDPSDIDGWALVMNANEKEEYTDGTQLLPVSSAGGEYELNSAHTFFAVEALLPDNGQTAKVPVTRQPGESPVFSNGSSRSTLPPTLLYEYGLQETSNGSMYVFASHDNINYLDEEVGDYSLSPSGTDGLYNQWHQGTIEYGAAHLLSITAYLHLGEVQQLSNFDNCRVRFYHPEGVVLGAIKSISVDARVTGLQPTRLEVLVL